MSQVALPGMETTPNMDARNAFARVPFPNYFGVDPETFYAVTPDAYEQSDPAVIEPKLYKKTDSSMKSPDQSIGWVVLNGAEYAITVDFPEALARKVQNRYTQTLPALLKPQEDRNAAAQRAGAHVLEDRLEPMVNLLTGYAATTENLRVLVSRIPFHWRAHGREGDMRVYAEAARGGIRDTLQTVADVESWSQDDLNLALIGLDKRLMAGRGQERLDEKKADWVGLARVKGNHTIAKRVVVRDRLLRSEAEISKRLRKGRIA